jgi:hypothetical protein
MNSKNKTIDVKVAAALMILFGLAEVVTSFSHKFFGLYTSSAGLLTLLSVAIGLCYFAA